MEGESSETGTVVGCLIIKFYFILSDWCQLLHYWQNKMFYQCSTEEVHSQAVQAVVSRYYFSKLLNLQLMPYAYNTRHHLLLDSQMPPTANAFYNQYQTEKLWYLQLNDGALYNGFLLSYVKDVSA